MAAGGAFRRGLGAFVDVAAVAAVPFHGSLLQKDLILHHVGQQLAVPRLMNLLDLGNLAEG